MNEANIFFACTAGIVGALSWWALAVLMNKGGDRLQRRLAADRRPGAAPKKDLSARAQISGAFQAIGQACARPFLPKSREKQSALRRQLGHAGIYSASAIRTVTGLKFILLILGLAGGYGLGLWVDNLLLGLSVGGLVGYLLPAMWIKSQIKRHRRGLEIGLPDALDLMVVCVEAGLTVDAALQRVSQELTLAHPRLARELEIAHMETRVGLSRTESLRNLGQRTGTPSLQLLATMLIQAERFGTSIAQSLRIHAEGLRASRQNAAEEMAAKASVKLSFPVVLFIFPALLIVLAGPAAIGLFKSALFAK